MRRDSNHTLRFPRSLAESKFGPYARWDVEPEPTFVERHIVPLVWMVAALAIGLLAVWVH